MENRTIRGSMRLRYYVSVSLLAAALALSSISAVMLFTSRHEVRLLEPLQLGTWVPNLPSIPTYPGQALNINNTLTNNANAVYKVRYTLNISAPANIKGLGVLYVNGSGNSWIPVVGVNFDGNTTVRSGDALIQPQAAHRIRLFIQTTADSVNGTITARTAIERLAP
ncbi:MAG: hypothetical protein QXS50_05230 [Candidatus Caldarchaeum sp.]